MSYLKLSWNTLLKASACSYPSSWQSGMIDSKMLIRVFIVASKLSKLKSRSYLVYLRIYIYHRQHGDHCVGMHNQGVIEVCE